MSKAATPVRRSSRRSESSDHDVAASASSSAPPSGVASHDAQPGTYESDSEYYSDVSVGGTHRRRSRRLMTKTEIAPVAEESNAADAPSTVTRVEMEVETQTLERSSSRNTPGRTRSKEDVALVDSGEMESKGDAEPAKSSSPSSADAQASQPEEVKQAEGPTLASRKRTIRGSKAKSRAQPKSSKAEAVDDNEADDEGEEEDVKQEQVANEDGEDEDAASPETRKLLFQWVQKLLPSDEEILRFHRRMQSMSLGALERKLKRRRQEVEEPMFSDDDGATGSDLEASEPAEKRHKPSIDSELDKFVDHYISLRAQAERVDTPAVSKPSQASTSSAKRQPKRKTLRQ